VTPQATILYGDAWELSGQLEPASVDCIVTSPPYWNLRDYGHDGQFGLEKTPEEYVAKLVDLFARLRPALKDEGTVWLNLGDSYAGNVLAGPAQSEKTTMTGGRKDFEIPARALCGEVASPDRQSCRYLPESFGVVAAWGFRYVQMLVWVKPGPMPMAMPFAPPATEFLLGCKRGRLPRLGSFPSSAMTISQGLHSVKPSAFQDYIEQVSPGPYLEMFARRNRLGWDTWGNECLEHVEVSP